MAELSFYNPRGSQEMSRELNNSGYQFDSNVTRAPENVVSIFTINTRAQFSTSGGVRFAGREPNERCRKVATISDPKYYVDALSIEGAKNQHKVITDRGDWVAMDWLNPANVYTLDQNYVVQGVESDGTNLLERGLFYIVRPYDRVHGNGADVPTEAELADAEKRLYARYDALVKLYHRTVAQSPAAVPGLMASGEMIDALNWAEIETPYNANPMARRVTCERCGDKVRVGVKFHKSETLGTLCIEPTQEGWKAAVNAGIKTRDDVPEDFRWAGRSPNPR